MPWIACDVTLTREPKTLLLAKAMGWSRKETVGNLLMLWSWCLDFAPDGDLSKFSHDLIAEGLDLPPVDGDRLVEALVKSGWLDEEPYLRMHEWWSLVGMFLKGRYSKEPWRWQKIRDQYKSEKRKKARLPVRSGTEAGSNLATTRSEPGRDQVRTTEHNRTIHHSTEHNSTEPPSPSPPPPPPPPPGVGGGDGDGGGSHKTIEDFLTLKREINKRSGLRRFSRSDERRLLQLLMSHGDKVIEACRYLHGGIENIPAYLSAVLEGKDDTAQLIREAHEILKKGAVT